MWSPIAIKRDGRFLRSSALRWRPDAAWVSLREKDLPEDEQVLLARTLLPITRRHQAFLMLHGEAALANLA
ncbi:MAG: hypothetical protein WBE71_15620, partial [Xanthobacteraceae bacterium]